MAVKFQKSDSGYPMLFMEKHMHSISGNVTVQSLVDMEVKAGAAGTLPARRRLPSIRCSA